MHLAAARADNAAMEAEQAFAHFVSRVLERGRAERLTSLAATKKGQWKILDQLCHEFESAILPSAVRSKDYQPLLNRPCFVFHAPMGFGVEFSTVRDAYAELSTDECWLIILDDASAGIHRPEGRWDAEKLILA